MAPLPLRLVVMATATVMATAITATTSLPIAPTATSLPITATTSRRRSMTTTATSSTRRSRSATEFYPALVGPPMTSQLERLSGRSFLYSAQSDLRLDHHP